MTTYNKKPGAVRRPGKDESRPKRTRMTAAQEAIHRRIAAQSDHSLSIPPRQWHPEEYPDLWRLVEAAKAAARSRRRLAARIVFSFEGRAYAARFTTTGRILIEDRVTGEFIASSGHFAV